VYNLNIATSPLTSPSAPLSTVIESHCIL
jgi:hypothetical protein